MTSADRWIVGGAGGLRFPCGVPGSWAAPGIETRVVKIAEEFERAANRAALAGGDLESGDPVLGAV